MKTFKTFNETINQDINTLRFIFENTWEYENVKSFQLVEKWSNPNQPWSDIEYLTQKTGDEAYKLYKKALEYVESAKDIFDNLLHKIAKNNRVIIDVKTINSFVDKVINRGKQASQIHDVLRAAILCKTESEVSRIANEMHRSFPILEKEYKKEGGNPDYGYFGSWHFKVATPIRGSNQKIIAEVQVMTEKLWKYKELAHMIYNQYRSVKDFDAEIKSKDLALSRLLFVVGNG